MKWYITEQAPVISGINTVRVVQKELGSEAAGIALKWPYKPVVTRVTGTVEVPVYSDSPDETDEFGFPVSIQTGTTQQDITEVVDWPYLTVRDGDLSVVTDDERAAIDAALAERAQKDISDTNAAFRERIAGRLVNADGTPNEGLIGLASAYRQALRAIAGPGAETNHAVTQDAVAGMMLQVPEAQYSAKTVDMLKLAFETLSGITGDGTTWTFFETVGDLIPEAGA